MESIGLISFFDKKIIYLENKKTIVKKFNVDDINTLNKNIIWFSDLSKEDIWRNGFLNFINIKHNCYFNTSFEEIKSVVNYQNNDYLVKMHFLFDKIIKLSIQYFNIDLNAQEFTLAIKNGLIKNEKQNPILTNHIKDALIKTYQDVILCLDENEKKEYIDNGYIDITIKKNGMLYTKELIEKISIPYSQNYSLMTKKEIEKKVKDLNFKYSTNKTVNEFLNSLNVPFLVQINKKKIKNKYENQKYILDNNSENYTYDKTKRIERKWINSIEFKNKTNFFDYDISNIIIFNKSLNFNEICEKYSINKFIFNDIYYFSIIFNIINENHIIALQEKENYEVNLLSSFLSSLEKKELLILVLMISSKGYIIDSYGRNKIKILIKKNEKISEDVVNLINKSGYYIFNSKNV